jgi:hypothetical protein
MIVGGLFCLLKVCFALPSVRSVSCTLRLEEREIAGGTCLRYDYDVNNPVISKQAMQNIMACFVCRFASLFFCI